MAEEIKHGGMSLPDMSAEAMLALSEAQFKALAEDFSKRTKTTTSPERLREILSAEAERQQARPPTMKEMPKEAPDESSVAIRQTLLTAMHELAVVDISRDKEKEDALREEADSLVRTAYGAEESKSLKGNAIAGMKISAIHKYKHAYLIQGAREYDQHIARGMGNAAASVAVVKQLRENAEKVNLAEERSGIWDAVHIFDANTTSQTLGKELGELARAIEGERADEEQKALFRRIIAAAKGAYFRGMSGALLEAHHVTKYRFVMPVFEKALRDSGIYKTEVDGVAGPTERYQQGTIGAGNAYRKNPRPRRSSISEDPEQF